jgi:hypothetical protein
MTSRFLMAHYMPWFQAKPYSRQWGWHWTMSRYDPDRVMNGRRDAASHYRPLIGLYDSADPDVLQCQVLLMRLAGIDGVIIDWYGSDDLFDYAAINRNTERLIPFLEKAGMRFALCYEDQTVPKLINAGRFPASEAVAHGQRVMRGVQQRYFSSRAYLKRDGRPVLLSFGIPYYTDEQWNQIFSVLTPKPLYFTEHERRAPTASVGAFDWPVPRGGTAEALARQENFYREAKNWPQFIPAAFPRFHDIYAEAGVHESWGRIEDRNGRTYVETLEKALRSDAPLVQLVTWNDWGEGTQIEPSVESGYRDLETTQRLRRRYLDPKFSPAARDLRLPVEWYHLRKRYAGDKPTLEKLAAFVPLVTGGKAEQARALLARYSQKQPLPPVR